MGVIKNKKKSAHRLKEKLYRDFRTIATAKDIFITDLFDIAIDNYISKFNLNEPVIKIYEYLHQEYQNSDSKLITVVINKKNYKEIRDLHQKSNKTIKALYELAMQCYIDDFKRNNKLLD